MRRRRALPSLKGGQGGRFSGSELGKHWKVPKRLSHHIPSAVHAGGWKTILPRNIQKYACVFRTKKQIVHCIFPDKISIHWLMCHSQFASFIIFWILLMSWNTSIFNVLLFLRCLVNLHEIQAHQRPASRHTTSQGASPRSQAQPRFRQVLYPCRIQWQTQSVSLWIYGNLMSI